MTIINDEPDKVDLKSLDIAEDKRRELLRLFSEARTEGGKIDFDRLKLALGETVDVGRERYGMNWPGKADCFHTIQGISVEIETGVVHGQFPPRAQQLVLEWAHFHAAELLENWQLARGGQPLKRIAPLE